MNPGDHAESHEAAALAVLFRNTMHAANNELMNIVQECELALMKGDPAVLKRALEYAIEHAMAISSLHRSTRQEILENRRWTGTGEEVNEHPDRPGGRSPAG